MKRSPGTWVVKAVDRAERWPRPSTATASTVYRAAGASLPSAGSQRRPSPEIRPGTGVSWASWYLTTRTDSRRPLDTRTDSSSPGRTPLLPSSGAMAMVSSAARGAPGAPRVPGPSVVQPVTPASSPAHVSTAASAALARRARPCAFLCTCLTNVSNDRGRPGET
ncbi:hypothetical protein GCM10020295_24500 [Streptomyces cinereospinus]